MTQATCAASTHENSAYISSALNLRLLRIVSHLNRTFMRDQKPDAAASSSALLGRYRCGTWGRRLSIVCESSCFVSNVDCAGLAGFGLLRRFGDRSACGVSCSGLLLAGPSVTELLLRRSPLLLLRSARYDRVEACLLQAARTVTETLCLTRFDRPDWTRSRCEGNVLTCDE